ncbi:MAG: hypothetical protein IIY21_09355 [Clostridiales bacterium]|nr:hypothetical protein [Clostridiales bacterium]
MDSDNSAVYIARKEQTMIYCKRLRRWFWKEEMTCSGQCWMCEEGADDE